MEWISVKDELPKRSFLGDIYIPKAKGGKRVTNVRWLFALGKFRSVSSGIEYDIGDISHFMQYQPPQGDNNE